MAHKGGNLWAHLVPCLDLGMRVALYDNSFEETAGEVKAFAFSDVVQLQYRLG